MKNVKILVPYNFTTYDQKSLEFVIDTFAHNADAEITLFSAYTPLPELKPQEATIMANLKSNLNYLAQLKSEQEKALQEAADSLVQGGFSQHQVQAVFLPRKKDVAAEIIWLAKAEHFSVIVMNHKTKKATHFFTGRVFSKVVTGLTNITVCVVT